MNAHLMRPSLRQIHIAMWLKCDDKEKEIRYLYLFMVAERG